MRLKTAKGRTLSSTRWLQRQLNDPFVAEARRLGYRSRAAFKLIEIDDKFGLLAPGAIVIDLGAAPGGWSQVAAERVGAADRRGQVVAIDLLEIDPIPGVEMLIRDFEDPDAPAALRALLGRGRADVVLSDMASPATGHRATDHIRVVALAELALDFACEVLGPGGSFLVKVFQGGAEGEMLKRLKSSFEKVRHLKPKASRAESPEVYVLATGFRDMAEDQATR